MRPRPIIYYEMKVGLGWTALLPLLALPLYATAYSWVVEPTAGGVRQAFELLLPLTAGLAAAPLMTVEREERFGELRATYPEPRWLLPLGRTLLAMLLVLGAAVFGWLCFRLQAGAYPFLEMALPAVGPAAFLLGLALLIGNLVGSYWAAAAAAMGYWFFEVLSRGQYTKGLYLFQKTWPLETVDYGANRWWLAGIGAALALLSAWISISRRSTR